MKINQVVYVCNECDKHETIETSAAITTRVGYISPIRDWYKVNKHGTARLHFCSSACLSLWAQYNSDGNS